MRRLKINRAIVLFFGLLIFLLVLASTFLSSEYFSTTVKTIIAENIPEEWGIRSEFSRIRLRFFPPGIEIVEPKIVLAEKNILKLPEGDLVECKRLILEFQTIPMLSGQVNVRAVTVETGILNIQIPKDTKIASNVSSEVKKGISLGIDWEDIFGINLDYVEIKNTVTNLRAPHFGVEASFSSRYVKIVREGKKASEDGRAYLVDIQIENVKGTFPKEWKIPATVPQLGALVRVSRKGIHIREIALQFETLQLSLQGELNGDILKPETLILDSKLSLNGPAADVLRALEIEDLQKELTALLTFEGEVKFRPKNFKESLQARGHLLASDVKFRDWQAERVLIQGNWIRKNEFQILGAEIISPVRPRVGGFQPGVGGIIRVGKFRYQFGQSTPIDIPVEFDQAHVHWLGAGAIDDVYPLNFRISGLTKIKVFPQKSNWKLEVLTDLRIPNFQLDNQRWQQKRPLRKLLEVRKMELQGPIVVDSVGVHLKGLKISLPETNFVANGKIDFKTGYAIKVGGTVDLEDFGTLSETEIKGYGNLKAHIHGPSSRVYVDFDTDLQNTEYINLNLGGLRGRIRWDDADAQLYFNNVQLINQDSLYVSNGKLDLAGDGTANIDFDLKKGDISDLIHVFGKIVEDLDWFPESLTGRTVGDIKVRGALDLRKLKITSNLRGNDWDFFGEKFKWVDLKGGYDGGKYYVSSVRARKYFGQLHGAISYNDRNQNIEWQLDSKDLSFRDFNSIARLDVPIRGNVFIKSEGKSKRGGIESSSEFYVSSFEVRGRRIDESRLKIESANQVLKFEGIANGNQGKLEGAYNFNSRATSHLNLELEDLDFSPVLVLINPKLIQDEDLISQASGKIHLKFNAGKFELGSGKIHFEKLIVQKKGIRFQLVDPKVLDVRGGDFDLEDLSVAGRGGVTHFSLKGRRSRLNGRIFGNLDLGFLEFLSSTVQQISGVANLNLGVGGGLKEPSIFGQVDFEGGEMKTTILESPFESLSARMTVRRGVLSIHKLESRLAKGNLSGKGTIEFFTNRFPKFDIGINLNRNRLKFFPFQYAEVEGGLKILGEKTPYRVEGSVRVLSALSREKALNRSGAGTRRTAKYTPASDSIQGGDTPTFNLNINAFADRGIWIKNDLFDAELKGRINILNTVEAPRFKGLIELVRGNLIFKDRIFALKNAKVEFDNPTVINPTVEMNGDTKVGNTSISVFVSGRLETLKVEFTSDPVMPESELLSLLAFGYTTDELQKLSSSDREVIQQGEAASLLLNSLDFNRDIREKTGLYIQVQGSVDTQAGSSIFRPQEETTAGAAPKIVIKRRIGKKVDVSVGSTVGVGGNSTKEVNAELELTPNVSVIGVWSTFEGGDETQYQDTSYGVDLKFEKRFK